MGVPPGTHAGYIPIVTTIFLTSRAEPRASPCLSLSVYFSTDWVLEPRFGNQSCCKCDAGCGETEKDACQCREREKTCLFR